MSRRIDGNDADVPSGQGNAHSVHLNVLLTAAAESALNRHMSRIVVVAAPISDLVTYTDQFPRPGENYLRREFSLGFGGKGANQAWRHDSAAATSRWSRAWATILFGPATLENLGARGIDTDTSG